MSRRGRCGRDQAVAAVWGAAEATAFFIVPDVWLSKVALRSPKRAYAACVSALGGAVVGGVVTYLWAERTAPEHSRAMLRRLPAISGAMIDRCEAEMKERGFEAMLLGPLRGVPYKIYARTAGVRGDDLGSFVAWSIPARIPRFLLVAYLAGRIRRRVESVIGPEQSVRFETPAHAAFWVAFYAWYLRTVGRE